MGGSESHRVAVAARLFADKGYAATTTRELSRALGITNGTFYHHFRSKEDLLVLICATSLARISEAVRDAVSREPDPSAAVEKLIHTHIRTMLLDQELHKTMLTELRSLSGDNLTQVRAQRDSYSDLVRSVIVDAQKGGALRPDIPAETLTLLLLNLLNWTIFWYHPKGGMTPDQLSAATTAVFRHGTTAPGS